MGVRKGRYLPIEPKPPAVKKRPKCPECRKPLRLLVYHVGYGPIKRVWKGYEGHGDFCTTQCAADWGARNFRASKRARERR